MFGKNEKKKKSQISSRVRFKIFEDVAVDIRFCCQLKWTLMFAKKRKEMKKELSQTIFNSFEFMIYLEFCKKKHENGK